MKTKNNSQKIVSAKIVAKLVELAAKCVIPCIKTSTPGKYTAKEIWEGKDSFGNNIWWSIDEEHNGDEISVAITAEDFTAEEMAILGYEPNFRLQIKLEKLFYAISKYEQLASVRGNNVAKFVVGEPATLYETERAKVVLFDYEKQKIVTKTKTITIISDSLAIYLHKKYFYAFCLKINGKWINVQNQLISYDIEETIERAKKRITYESTKSRAEKYIAQNTDSYADFVQMILAEFRAMEQSSEAKTADNADPSAETSCTAASNAEAVGNCNADGDSNVNTEAKASDEAQSTAEGNKYGGGDDVRKQADTPQSNESAPPEQSKREKPRGREIAVLSDFRGKGDKVYRQSGENRNLGNYCGKNEVLSANVRGSPQSATINSIHNSNKYSLTYKLYQRYERFNNGAIYRLCRAQRTDARAV